MGENVEEVVEQTPAQAEEVPVEETPNTEDAELLTEEVVDPDDLTEEEKEAAGNEIPLVELLKRADVKDFLKRVRQQEKNKLYEQIKKKDDTIKDLNEEVTVLKRTIEAYKAGNDTTIADLKVEIEALKNKVEVAEKAKAEQALELYRNRAIQSVRDSGADLIDDLVSGNSEAEIDSSIEIAKAKYDEVVAKATAKRETAPVPKPIAPKQEAGARKLTMDEIAKMSPAEYAKHREEIKKGIF